VEGEIRPIRVEIITHHVCVSFLVVLYDGLIVTQVLISSLRAKKSIRCQSYYTSPLTSALSQCPIAIVPFRNAYSCPSYSARPGFELRYSFLFLISLHLSSFFLLFMSIPLNGPLHSGIPKHERGCPVQNLSSCAAEGVEDGSIQCSGEGVKSV
jgi:hypothetical protein